MLTSIEVGGISSESSDWSINADIFNIFSLIPPEEELCLAGSTFCSSAHGSTSWNSVSVMPLWHAHTLLARRHTSPIWVAGTGRSPAPSGPVACVIPANKPDRGNAARSRMSSPKSPTVAVNASQASPGTPKCALKAPMFRNCVRASHLPNKAMATRAQSNNKGRKKTCHDLGRWSHACGHSPPIHPNSGSSIVLCFC